MRSIRSRRGQMHHHSQIIRQRHSQGSKQVGQSLGSAKKEFGNFEDVGGTSLADKKALAKKMLELVDF